MAKVQMWVGNLQPSLRDKIVDASGVGVNLTNYTVKFYMRGIYASTNKINGVAAVFESAATGDVRYDWIAGNVDTYGEYVGWWQVIGPTPTGNVQDTPEFTISFGTHQPLIDDTVAFTWPTREYLEAVSTFDYSDLSQERFLAWSRGAISDMSLETGRNSAYFLSLAGVDPLAQVARDVWQMLIEQRSVKRRDDVMESEYDDTYQSISTTGYSENKRSLKDSNPLFARMVNSSAELSRKLWMLMTDAKRDELRALSGEVVPAEYIQEIDWFSSESQPPNQSRWWNL